KHADRMHRSGFTASLQTGFHGHYETLGQVPAAGIEGLCQRSRHGSVRQQIAGRDAILAVRFGMTAEDMLTAAYGGISVQWLHQNLAPFDGVVALRDAC